MSSLLMADLFRWGRSPPRFNPPYVGFPLPPLRGDASPRNAPYNTFQSTVLRLLLLTSLDFHRMLGSLRLPFFERASSPLRNNLHHGRSSARSLIVLHTRLHCVCRHSHGSFLRTPLRVTPHGALRCRSSTLLLILV